jgi:hypothetical protein
MGEGTYALRCTHGGGARPRLIVQCGDIKGHDKLCGHYNRRTLQVKQVCHHCDIPIMDCDNAFYPWRHHVKPDVVHSLVYNVAGVITVRD